MDGIIIINKPKNCTSHDVVRKAKKILNEKVGHTGTLDPNATGVLPILVGTATKISKYLIEHDKEYEAITSREEYFFRTSRFLMASLISLKSF